jgi:hypothetical protein
MPPPSTTPGRLEFSVEEIPSSLIVVNRSLCSSCRYVLEWCFFEHWLFLTLRSLTPHSSLSRQLVIIIAFTQGLGFIFKPLRQPRVIAEVIGGIILGPTALGRIPGFTQNIFPPASLPFLNLIATIGLVLFLFLVGMEVDVGVVRRDWKAAVLVSAAGLIIPFGAGAGIAAAIYREFVNTEEVTYGHFLLFVGVAGTLRPSHNSSNPTSTNRNRPSPLPQSRSQHSQSSVGS